MCSGYWDDHWLGEATSILLGVGRDLESGGTLTRELPQVGGLSTLAFNGQLRPGLDHRNPTSNENKALLWPSLGVDAMTSLPSEFQSEGIRAGLGELGSNYNYLKVAI